MVAARRRNTCGQPRDVTASKVLEPEGEIVLESPALRDILSEEAGSGMPSTVNAPIMAPVGRVTNAVEWGSVEDVDFGFGVSPISTLKPHSR
jgi:hypothetical protein